MLAHGDPILGSPPRQKTPLWVNISQKIRREIIFVFFIRSKIHRAIKIYQAVDVSDLVNAHSMKLVQSAFVNIIYCRDGVRKFSEFYRDLEKISAEPLLRTMNDCFHRWGDPRREIIYVPLLLEVSKIELYRFLYELTWWFAIVRLVENFYLVWCWRIYPQRDSYFCFMFHKKLLSATYEMAQPLAKMLEGST